ncbi:hypothetical protein [Fusobacterium polymorphum]|uniref:Uncharacterized protein n=1 Tax=Fusobacterium nucleatum subsp. polymorphum TaxID=76857 RepID=A0A2C6A4D6_FUSNP|nr:hypothetical protein [Fusobacterium polymorphum]PHI06570.1 hypothetical protein CBG54_05765 [Fusobacterium polymorphum]
MLTFKNSGVQFYFFFSNRGFAYNRTSGELIIEVDKKITRLQVEAELDYQKVFIFFDVFSTIK